MQGKEMSVSSAKPLPGNDQITNYIIILINMVWSLLLYSHKSQCVSKIKV